MSSSVPRSRIADLVCARVGKAVAAEECCAALRAAPVDDLECSMVEKAHLLRIYRIRLGRRPDVVLGADELLHNLEAYGGTHVTSCVLDWQGRVYGILCNEEVSDVVACFVGDDRRFAVSSPGR